MKTLEQIAMEVALALDPEMRADDDPGHLYEFSRRLVAALGAQEPRAWITGGDCYENGHIDCLAWREGEFTTPLFAAPMLPSVPESTDSDTKLLAAQARIKVLMDALESADDLHAEGGINNWDMFEGNRKRALSISPEDTAEIDALVKDAERYRWLRDTHGYSYGMGCDTPAECGIAFGWQQSKPEESDWSIEQAIDFAMQKEKS